MNKYTVSLTAGAFFGMLAVITILTIILMRVAMCSPYADIEAPFKLFFVFAVSSMLALTFANHWKR